MSRVETSALWDALARARTFTGQCHRLPLRLLVAVAVTFGVTVVGSLLTLTSGDYGPKGTGATGVVWGFGGIVAVLLLAAVVAHGVRTLVVVVGGLGVVKELVARGEAGAPDTERELHAARTQLRKRGLPAAALWIVLGLIAMGKVVALTV